MAALQACEASSRAALRAARAPPGDVLATLWPRRRERPAQGGGGRVGARRLDEGVLGRRRRSTEEAVRGEHRGERRGRIGRGEGKSFRSFSRSHPEHWAMNFYGDAPEGMWGEKSKRGADGEMERAGTKRAQDAGAGRHGREGNGEGWRSWIKEVGVSANQE